MYINKKSNFVGATRVGNFVYLDSACSLPIYLISPFTQVCAPCFNACKGMAFFGNHQMFLQLFLERCCVIKPNLLTINQKDVMSIFCTNVSSPL